MSETVVTYPINGCLKGAEQMLGAIREWVAANPIQARYLADYFGPGGSEVAKIPEMKTKASRAAAEINAFLQDNGFTLTIDEIAPDEFAVASLIKVLVQWLVEGKEATVDYRGKSYPAVRLTDEAAQVVIWGTPSRAVAQIPTKSQDVVYLTALGDQARTGFDLVGLAQILSSDIHARRVKPLSSRYEGVIFPMVDLDLTYDLDWLVGAVAMPEQGDPYKIAKALQQSRLKMNRKGALAESAAVIVMRCLCVKSTMPLVIDQPFLCWFERPGLSQPLFTAYVTPEDWKDPGEIPGP